jgi:carbamoyl-phosphate synthase small subunit
MTQTPDAVLELEDGTKYRGTIFGSNRSCAGEVVFNTGMVGYPEMLTDPSYHGQIITMTYPLVGNYGISREDGDVLERTFESDRIQASALIVTYLANRPSHWSCSQTLDNWLKSQDIPGIYGIDTRALTKRLREHGTMLGRITAEEPVDFYDINQHNLVKNVSITEPEEYKKGFKKVVLIDCGLKLNILRSLLDRDINVTRVGWDYDFTDSDYDGVLVSNGPGDPTRCSETINVLKKVIDQEKPIMGICLGNQLLALALGGSTYKLKYGHRSQNQPCMDLESGKCYITSQNHGFAVDGSSLPEDVEVWFENLNDGTCEGIKHKQLPIFATQFHPEDCPGPTDTRFIFDKFIEQL